MPAPLTPVANPVTFSFDNADLQLTSVVGPGTKQHSVICDLCSQVIKLGIRGSITRISQHRGEECRREAFNMVSEAMPIMLWSYSDQLMEGW